MKNRKYLELKKNVRELYVVPPNDLGIPIFTTWYRSINKYFKSAPFIIIVPLTIALFLVLALISRFLIVNLATFIQYGY